MRGGGGTFIRVLELINNQKNGSTLIVGGQYYHVTIVTTTNVLGPAGHLPHHSTVVQQGSRERFEHVDERRQVDKCVVVAL